MPIFSYYYYYRVPLRLPLRRLLLLYSRYRHCEGRPSAVADWKKKNNREILVIIAVLIIIIGTPGLDKSLCKPKIMTYLDINSLRWRAFNSDCENNCYWRTCNVTLYYTTLSRSQDAVCYYYYFFFFFVITHFLILRIHAPGGFNNNKYSNKTNGNK